MSKQQTESFVSDTWCDGIRKIKVFCKFKYYFSFKIKKCFHSRAKGRFKMTHAWKHADDASLDLWLFSDISCHDVDIHEPPTQPILQYNARLGANNNVSIFDAELPHEEVTYVSSGRGRGGVSKFFKPGLPVNSCLDEEDDIKRRLREVSGLGYSNELIEQRFKKTVPVPSPVNETEFCDIQDDEKYYQSFNNRSPEKSRFSSPASSKSESYKISTCLSSNTSSPKKELTTDNQLKPPPLSLILKKAKEKTSNTNKEHTSKVQSFSKSNNDKMTVLKSELNPEAVEFKLSPRGSLGSERSTQEIEQSSHFNHDRISTECDSRANSTGSCSSRSSTGEELAWRRRDGTDSSRRLFNWNHRGNGYTSEEDYPYRQAAISRTNGRRRDFSRMEVFDLRSDSDFPTLS